MKHGKHKCIDCIHCNGLKMICTPESEDALPAYVLTYSDLVTEDYCDFFSEKKEEKA